MPINFTGTYTTTFDTLTTDTNTASTWSNDQTLPGWFLLTQAAGGTPVTTYRANAGDNPEGSFYSFGTIGSGDRALGGVGSSGDYFGDPASGASAGWIAFAATNATGATVNDLTVTFNGEQWRNGGNTTAQAMNLAYAIGTDFTSIMDWTPLTGRYTWVAPVATSSAASVDGNSVGRVANLGGTLTNLNWANGQTLWLRWTEQNNVGTDHGLAIDDFSLSRGNGDGSSGGTNITTHQTRIGTAGDDLLTFGNGNDFGSGLAGNDSLTGGEGNDTLVGNEGNDRLSGEAGDDLLFGNTGVDQLTGGTGNDLIAAGQGDDSANGDAGDDFVFGNLGTDQVSGGDGNDYLGGGQGADTLIGGSGNDTLAGDVGDDVLTGGDGADTFRLKSGQGSDVITDFVVGTDKLGLVEPLTFSALNLTTEAMGAVTIRAGGQLLVTVMGATSLSSEDFVVIA